MPEPLSQLEVRLFHLTLFHDLAVETSALPEAPAVLRAGLNLIAGTLGATEALAFLWDESRGAWEPVAGRPASLLAPTAEAANGRRTADDGRPVTGETVLPTAAPAGLLDLDSPAVRRPSSPLRALGWRLA